MSENLYPFDFSPKLIKFLGEELIHDKKIAIAELVKNAYDADASEVLLTISDNKVAIEDNGNGMNKEVVLKSWLKVGDSSKADRNTRSSKYKRLPIGEKGIGRLGVHKLGNKVRIVSKTSQDLEVSFEVDWNQFENTTSLQALEPIKVILHDEPKIFLGGTTGTKLIVEDLKESFDSKDLTSINTDLINLLPPFKHTIQDTFKITLITQNGIFEDKALLNVSHIIEHALFYYKIVFNNGEITQFNYSFISPDDNKITSRQLTLTSEEVQDAIERLMTIHEISNVDEKSKIGEVTFEGYIFDSKFSKLFQKPYSKQITNYLKANGGIRVYRDGMRVYNYGEGGKDNDILNLDRKRAKRLGDNIGYNQLLASIELDREASKNLVEKTNREGFIHNQAFALLQEQLDFCMELVMHCRKIDRAEMEPLFGKEYDKTDIDTKIKKIVSQVEKLPIDDKKKSNITNELYRFSQEFEQLKNIFLTASNTGLNMTFIIHEIDKIIDHLEQKIQDKDLTQIESIFLHLKNSINAYKDIIRLDKRTTALSVNALIDQALFNSNYRFNSHNIECIRQIEPDLRIIAKKGLILGVFNNLFDNTIYWLDYYKIEHKKILLRVYQDGDFIHIIIADNGKGFNISFKAALGPFITGRIDGSSMGIGLHLAEQVMIAHQGSIEHGNWKTDQLPEEFENGAIIKLGFKKGE